MTSRAHTRQATSVRLAGAGGQGVALAGKILAEAALISGRTAAFSQLYGPESRGGSSHSDVIIAEGEVGFPIAQDLDVLVALTAKSLEKNLSVLLPGALLIVDDRADSDEATAALNGSKRSFPMFDLAKTVGGNQLMTGVVALGALETATGIVGIEPLRKAVTALVPGAHRAANLRALEAGLELGR